MTWPERVIQVHAVDAADRRMVARVLKREQFLAWCAQLTTLLVLQPCWHGAYQTGSRVWQDDDRPPHHARQLRLPMPDGSTIDTLASGSLGVEGTLDRHEAAKGRGIADCWGTHDGTWSGDRLALVSASESDCWLFEAGGLPVDLWRTQVKLVK